MFSALVDSATLVTIKTANAASSVLEAGGFDPGVSPNSDAPWTATLRKLSGSFVGSLLIASVVILAVGVVVALIGKAAGSTKAQQIGIGGLIVGLIGVVVLGSINGLVYWATQQSIF